jgi:hypothetical protein
MFLEPKVTCSNYVSYFFSPYHRWFEEWGYPQLDIVLQDSGAWGIIQTFNTPVIPSLTKWNWVVLPMKNREINPWIAKKYVENLDLERQYAWDEVERREKEWQTQLFREQLHLDDMRLRMFNAIKGNPDLMNRIAKNGLGEARLSRISRQIPNFRFRKDSKHGISSTIHHSSKPIVQDLSTGVGRAADC